MLTRQQTFPLRVFDIQYSLLMKPVEWLMKEKNVQEFVSLLRIDDALRFKLLRYFLPICQVKVLLQQQKLYH